MMSFGHTFKKCYHKSNYLRNVPINQIHQFATLQDTNLILSTNNNEQLWLKMLCVVKHSSGTKLPLALLAAFLRPLPARHH